MIKSQHSRLLVIFMMLTVWISFIASIWLGVLIKYQFGLLAIFWLVVTILLAFVLSAKSVK